MINYECIKEVTKTLRKNFKGIQSNSYGFCCNTDYNAHHKYINENDFVCAKIFKGGLNNDYNYEDGVFELSNTIYFNWNLTEFTLDDIIETMEEVCNKYGYKIIRPINAYKCIGITEENVEE